MNGTLKTNRTLVIGDIHGGLKSLTQVLKKAKVSKDDKLIFLGDYVDGWSESAEVIQYLIDLNKTYECVFLRGNHDAWCQDWLIMGHSPNHWLMQGGNSTVESYIKTGYLSEDSHRDFFKNLRNYYVDEDNNGFVHGGFRSRKGLGHEVYQADYYWDRDLWNIALLSNNKTHLELDGTSAQKRHYKHKEIFIGHTSTLNYNVKPHLPEYEDTAQPRNGAITIPMHRCNVWNVDTGGGFKGKLTIMDIKTKKYWQSDLLSDLYPEEKGR